MDLTRNGLVVSVVLIPATVPLTAECIPVRRPVILRIHFPRTVLAPRIWFPAALAVKHHWPKSRDMRHGSLVRTPYQIALNRVARCFDVVTLAIRSVTPGHVVLVFAAFRFHANVVATLP